MERFKKLDALKICLLFALAAAALSASSALVFSSRRNVLEVFRKGAGEDAPVFHSRRVRRISFENYADRVNLLVHHYLKAGYPVPGEFPSHAIEWSALLDARESGYYGFKLDASHPAELVIGGEKVLSGPGEVNVPIHRGVYDFRLRFVNDDGDKGLNRRNLQLKRGSTCRGIPTGRLRLAWKPPGVENWKPVEGDAFLRPGAESPFSARRILPFVFAAGLAAVALYAAEPKLYKKFFIEKRYGVAAACVAAAGFLLRLYQHGIVPVYVETWDEVGAAWSGFSMIRYGVPMSWSLLRDAYAAGRPVIRWFGTHFHMAVPYFDHPPLFHLAAGAAAILSGAESFLGISVSPVRLLPVFLSSSVTVILYAVLKGHYPRRAALLASFLYAFVPTIAVSGRLVQEDNMMVFLIMLGLLFYSRSLEREGWKSSVPVALCAGLAALSKFTAVSFIGIFSLLYFIRGRRKPALVVLFGGGALAALYFLWGRLVDWDMFLRVFSSQGGKIPQFAMPVRLAFLPKLVADVFWDGGVLFLWLSMPAFIFIKKDGFSRDIGILFGVYFILIASTINMDYGWYAITMYPFLCAAGGLMIYELLRSRSPLLMVFFTGFAVMMNLQAVLPPHARMSPRLPLLLAAGLLLPVLASHAFPGRKAERAAFAAVLTALFVFALTGAIMVANFSDIYYGDPAWARVLEF